MLDCVVIHCFPPYDGFIFFFWVGSQDARAGASRDQQRSLKEYGGMSN